MTDQEIIDSIFNIRVANNMPWKRLIELAMKHAPDEAKDALRQIEKNDAAIAGLTRVLTK